MSAKTPDKIKSLLSKDNNIRLGRIPRNLKAIQFNASFLDEHLKVLETALEAFQTTLRNTSPEVLTQPEIHPDIKIIVENYDKLLDSLHAIKQTTVASNIEGLVLDIQEEIEATLKKINFILSFAVTNKPGSVQSQKIFTATASSLQYHKSKSTNLKIKVHRLSSIGAEDKNQGYFSNRVKALFSIKRQMILWLLVIFTLIVFQFTESELELTLSSFRNPIKFVILFITLWFPAFFIAPQRISIDYAIHAIIWAVLACIWCYGLAQGALIATILYIVPLQRLLTGRDTNAPIRFYRGFVKPIAVSLLFVGLFITREFIWLIGLAIWLTYLVFLINTSYRFFRQNYDLIEDLFPNPKSRDQRSIFLVGSLIVSSVILTTGLLGRINGDFVSEFYSTIITFATALVTILLAVQAIIPGMNVWSRESNIDKRIREMRFVIRANQGLGGFMSSFFYLLVISVCGWLLTKRFGSDLSVVVDLSTESIFTPFRSFIDVLNPFSNEFSISYEHTLLSLNTLLFVVCFSLAVYSIFQLYYLFTTASIFLLPIQDALYSSPVHIEKINLNVSISGDQKDQIEKTIRDLFISERRLNGYVINEINIINDIEYADRMRITVRFEMDFIELDEMLRLARNTYKALFDSRNLNRLPLGIERVGFSVFRETHERGSHNVFSLQVNREEWEFLKMDQPHFSFEYKVRNVLQAKIVEYVLPDAQIF